MKKTTSINQYDYKKLKAKICYLCEVNDISLRELAKASSIAERTLYERQNNPNTYRVEELFLIAKSLRTNIQELFN